MLREEFWKPKLEICYSATPNVKLVILEIGELHGLSPHAPFPPGIAGTQPAGFTLSPVALRCVLAFALPLCHLEL